MTGMWEEQAGGGEMRVLGETGRLLARAHWGPLSCGCPRVAGTFQTTSPHLGLENKAAP